MHTNGVTYRARGVNARYIPTKIRLSVVAVLLFLSTIAGGRSAWAADVEVFLSADMMQRFLQAAAPFKVTYELKSGEKAAEQVKKGRWGLFQDFTSFRGLGLMGVFLVFPLRMFSLKRVFLTRTALIIKKIMTDFSHSSVGSKVSICFLYSGKSRVREASSRHIILSAICSRVFSIITGPMDNLNDRR